MKIIIIPLVISFVFPIYAQDNFHAVSDQEAGQITCANLKPTPERQMTDYLESRIANLEAEVSASVRGVNFKNEVPELIEFFQGIHTPSWSYNLKSLPATKCEKVKCVMEQYYGKKLALPMLYIYAKFGVTTSKFGSGNPDNYQNWSATELRDVLIALETLPPTVLPLKDTHILHFKNGYTLAQYGDDNRVIANARIDVFDLWNTKSQLFRVTSLIHEFGHVLGNKVDDSPEWLSMPRAYISEYATTNAAEDFAESFLAYRITPNKLQKNSPQRYNFIRQKIFNGLQFKTKKDCIGPFSELSNHVQTKISDRRELAAWLKKSNSAIQSQVQRQEQMGSFRATAWKVCGSTYLSELENPANRELTEKCLAQLVKSRAVVVERRQSGKEDLQESAVPVKPLQQISVTRRYLGILRQQIRFEASKNLEQFYDENFNGSSCDVDYNHAKRFRMDKYPVLSRATQPLDVLIKRTCEKMEQKSFWTSWLGPNFEKLLP